MSEEMFRTSRWYYEKEPVWPPGKHNRNSWFRKRSLYPEIIRVVRENPGISTGEVARKVGKSYDHISPLLFHLRNFGSLRYEPIGRERIKGLEAFAKVPCVKQMLSKLSSEKTKGPWLRRLFRYQEWLIGKGYFGSVAELLEDCRAADTEGRYRHIDLMQEYLNSFRGAVYYKDSIATIIRGFYKKNRAQLPMEKITYDRGMLIMAPSSTEEYIRPTEVWRIVSDGRVPARDKAMIATVLCMGLDETTFAHQFNYFAYPQIVKARGKDKNDWDVRRAPVQVSLVRPKTQARFYNFLPAKALVLLRDWLNVRKEVTGSEVMIRNEGGVEVSDPLFVTIKRRPVDEAFVGNTIRHSSFRSGVQERKEGVKRYRIHGHEFRDTFRTTCKVAGVDQAVAEFFIGHSIDALGYDYEAIKAFEADLYPTNPTMAFSGKGSLSVWFNQTSLSPPTISITAGGVSLVGSFTFVPTFVNGVIKSVPNSINGTVFRANATVPIRAYNMVRGSLAYLPISTTIDSPSIFLELINSSGWIAGDTTAPQTPAAFASQRYGFWPLGQNFTIHANLQGGGIRLLGTQKIGPNEYQVSFYIEPWSGGISGVQLIEGDRVVENVSALNSASYPSSLQQGLTGLYIVRYWATGEETKVVFKNVWGTATAMDLSTSPSPDSLIDLIPATTVSTFGIAAVVLFVVSSVLRTKKTETHR